MRASRRRRGRKGLPGIASLARVDGVAGDPSRRPRARAAGEGRFAMDGPSGSEASPAMFPGLLRSRTVAKIRMCETAHA